jgi:DNA-binding MarR family transcriptional regulator
MTENYSASDELLSKCERMLWRTLPSVLHGTRKLAQDELFGDLQLTPAQFHTIRNIHRGANSVSDLAACERVSPPAISRHVDDLVNMGLVERTRDTEDRRSIILALTKDGQAVWDRMLERNHKIFSEKMKQMSTKDLQTIIAALELLYSAFADEAPDFECEADGGKHHHA